VSPARSIAILGSALLLGVACAQDAQFTQFYSAPTYLSPAFAGTAAQSRMALQYRDQWPSIPGAFVTYNVAFDHYLNELNSGIGLIATHDKAGSGAMSYTSITGQYAYEIELKRKVFLRPALQFGYVNHAVDYTRLVFGDQLVRGGDIGTYENLARRSIGYVDMGTGLLFFTPKLWLGMAYHHFFAGLWYRGLPLKSYGEGRPNNDAIAVLAGVMVKDWRFGYSYDLTVSGLAGRTGGAHEVSIVYDWADRRRRKAMSKRRVVPCAKF
jgi:hypothetical protein